MKTKNSQNYIRKEVSNVVNPAVLNYIKVNDRLNDTAGFIDNNLPAINNNLLSGLSVNNISNKSKISSLSNIIKSGLFINNFFSTNNMGNHQLNMVMVV